MSEQSLALVPGPKQHVLAAGSGKSSLPEMGMLQDTPKGSLELLQPCLIWGHVAPSPTSHLQVSKIIEYTEGGIAENLKGFLWQCWAGIPEDHEKVFSLSAWDTWPSSKALSAALLL